MKLDDAPYAPNPSALRLFIAERGGLALDVAAMDLLTLENGGLAFRSINPFCIVPALVPTTGRS